MKTEIYIATHKAYNFPKLDGYIPIHVGKALTDLDLGILGDDTGNNISVLNPNFCELTALYWMWKNSDADVIGLVHYRRYFFENKLSNTILTKEKIEEIFNNGIDIIVPKKIFIHSKFKPLTSKNHYIKEHNIKDWELLEEIILNLYPGYVAALEFVSKSYKSSFYNMFIMRREIFNEYCDWLFNILFLLKDKININTYDKYQARIFAFLSERLLNIFIYNKYKICFIPVKNIEEKSIKSKIKLYTGIM